MVGENSIIPLPMMMPYAFFVFFCICSFIVIELTIKACLVSQNDAEKNIEEKIDEFRNLLCSTNITMIKDINFKYFTTEEKDLFITDAKKFYGKLCNYVHATPTQMKERLGLEAKGRTIGFEGINELREMNDELSKALYIALVLLFHAVPQWCVGDFLVESDGSTVNNYFTQYKFISIIDQHFDYKFERQNIISELQLYRQNRVCY